MDVSDGDFVTVCTCGLEQRLSRRSSTSCPASRCTTARACENTLVAILSHDAVVQLRLRSAAVGRQLASGMWRSGYVFGSRVDVGLRPPDAVDDVLQIHATPPFFDALLNL